MPLSKPLRIASLPLLLFALPACTGDDDGADDEVGETEETESGDTTESGETTETETGETTTETGETTETESESESESETETGEESETGDEKPELGATPNVLCEAALASFATIVAENQNPDPDPMVIEEAYVDTGLQEFVQLAGVVTGRIEDGVLIDDAAILELLDAEASALDMLDLEWRIVLVMHLYIRATINEVSGTLPDPANDPALLYAQWDAAYCYWDGALRPLGQLADQVGPDIDAIEADIDAGFQLGHDHIEGAQPWAIDEFEVPAAKQQVEKTLYSLFHRLTHAWSSEAVDAGDTPEALALAHMAYGAFQPLEDRMAGRNTPGIAIIEEQLLGDPTVIDPDDVLRQMNIAFAKRTRRYTNHALPDVDGTIGTAPGYAAAVEGFTYNKLIDPYLDEAIDGFDQMAYRETWQAWIDAIRNDDLPAAETASAELVDWNCQYQEFLLIAECTASADEPAP
ncbi:MAG: hypothetical protein HC927_13885 [Deltaproteobacteria bacterium]|nr:hypothetical protein [Deltaproteobacteria bacterium]